MQWSSVRGGTFRLTNDEWSDILKASRGRRVARSQAREEFKRFIHHGDKGREKNRSAGVAPASEPRQLLLGQHDLCRLEAGDTFFLTTKECTEISQRHQVLRASPCAP